MLCDQFQREKTESHVARLQIVLNSEFNLEIILR